jgi:hypothetical protein
MDAWSEYISEKYGCEFIPISNIIFKNSYNILKEPDINLFQDRLTVYYIDSNNIYCSFNVVCSKDESFSPYWEKKIIKLEYLVEENLYVETEQFDVKKYKDESFILNLISNPFVHKSNQITNTIIY